MAEAVLGSLLAALFASLALLGFSLRHYSRAGPGLPPARLRPFRRDIRRACVRLMAWTYALCLAMAAGGAGLYALLAPTCTLRGAVLAGLAGIAACTGYRFLHLLLFNPGLIVASLPCRASRLYPLWRQLSPARLRLLPGLLAVLLLAWFWHPQWPAVFLVLAPVAAPPPTARAARSAGRTGRQPRRLNLVMIGCDSLRADHVYGAPVATPGLSALQAVGTAYRQCETACARTAPALLSLFTGCWPTTHGVRDNFLTADTLPALPTALPRLLAAAGYHTTVVSDWCGADFGKFDFGFAARDLPPDQWNLRWLIRQGPKPLRLFLSLFANGDLGRRWLPEIHFQGGVPSTGQLLERARRELTRMARRDAPFFLNVFFSTTHAPFASEYPWYATPEIRSYDGESRFALAGLTDPQEILRRQVEPQTAFELDQLWRLYRACVRQFDAAVAALRATLAALGIDDQTCVVVYADHGTDFFEHGCWGQGNAVRASHSNHVPLLLHDPRRPRAAEDGRGTRTVDLLPTLLELLDLPLPPGLDGRSLFANDPAPRTRYTETGLWVVPLPGQSPEHLAYPDLMELLVPQPTDGTLVVKPGYRQAVLAAKDRAVQRGRWKLLYEPCAGGPRLALFDTRTDPACARDIAPRHPAKVHELLVELAPFLRADGLPLPAPTGIAACV